MNRNILKTYCLFNSAPCANEIAHLNKERLSEIIPYIYYDQQNGSGIMLDFFFRSAPILSSAIVDLILLDFSKVKNLNSFKIRFLDLDLMFEISTDFFTIHRGFDFNIGYAFLEKEIVVVFQKKI